MGPKAMRITKHTDYALRVLLFLAVRPGQRISTQSIADAHGISLNHLHKVVRALGDLGLLVLVRGATGGIELAVDPAKVTVGSVMRELDDQSALIECFQSETDDCVISPACGLKGALREAQEAFYASLDGVNLKDLASGKRAARLRKLTE